MNTNNVRGTFLTVKHFLRSVKQAQETQGGELDNVAIVITGSETGKFGQEGHSEYISMDQDSKVRVANTLQVCLGQSRSAIWSCPHRQK